MDHSPNPQVPWMREYSGEVYQKGAEIDLGAPPVYSPRLFLNTDEIPATTESIGLITPIAEARFEE